MTTLEEAARAVVRARDYKAEHGHYDAADFHPDADQCFDDWAADILSQSMDTDARAAAARKAAPELLASLIDLLTPGRVNGSAIEAGRELIARTERDSRGNAPSPLFALQAIKARVNGEWDNPALVAIGPLGSISDDVLRIIAASGVEV